MNTKVMIVEDEMIVALSYQQALKRADFEVLPMINTGEKALESAMTLNPDIVLMDINLKGKLSGIEAARSIKAEIDTSIIYISGNTDNETREAAMATGPAAFLYKPLSNRDLIYRIREILNYKLNCNLLQKNFSLAAIDA